MAPRAPPLLIIPPPPCALPRACFARRARPYSNLYGKGLQGSIPDDPQLWIDLPSLKKLDVSDNQGLSGSLPQALSSSPSLNTM